MIYSYEALVIHLLVQKHIQVQPSVLLLPVSHHKSEPLDILP